MASGGLKKAWQRIQFFKTTQPFSPQLERTDSALGGENFDDPEQFLPQSRGPSSNDVHETERVDVLSQSSFEYKRLNETRNEIRILHLISGPNDDEIACSLQHYSCTHKYPEYTALSYCWGDLKDPEQVTVDGSNVSITSNLAAALLALRRAGHRRIWVDALCINQLDPDEKSTQILRMSAIYQNASSTIAWLGNDEKNQAEIAFKHLRLMAAQHPKAEFEAFIAELFTGYMAWRNDPGWSSIKSLMEFPYWRRTWIIQELALSRVVHFWWGQASIDLDVLDTALSTLRDRKPKDYFESGYKDILYLLVVVGKTRRTGSKAKGMELERILTFSCRSLASEPKDKIFGVLGLSTNGSDILPKPDYRHSLDDVLIELSVSRLRRLDRHTPNKVNRHNPSRSRPLDLICIDNPTVSKRPELPSWVTDWRSIWRGPAGNFWSSSVERGLHSGYLACGASPTFTRVSDDKTTLTVRGYIFDHIQSASGVYLIEDIKHRTFLSPGTTEPHLDDAVELSVTSNVYGSEADLYEAIWRGLIADRYWQGKGKLLIERPPASYSALFRALYSGESTRPKGERLRLTYDCLTAVKSFKIYGRSLGDWSRYNPAGPSQAEELTNGGIDVQDFAASTPPDSSEEDILEFVYACKFRDMFHRRVLATRKGYVGLAHAQSEAEDLICLLQGCTVPMVLRPCEGRYRVIGDAYVHGIMNGEYWSEQTESSMQQFDLK